MASRQEAEDLTQEVFLRALRRLGDYRSETGSFRPYLVAVAHNLLRDRWRAHGRIVRADVDPDDLETRDRGPEAATLAGERRSSLVAGLARLPELYRLVLQMRLLEQRPAAEVAALLDRSPDAVRQLQHRALIALRAELEDEEEGRVEHG